jgi:putative serine protease PepD
MMSENRPTYGYPDYGYPSHNNPYGYQSSQQEPSLPPAPPKSRRPWAALVVGAAVTAVVAGGVGGAVGYTAARATTSPAQPTASAGLIVATETGVGSPPADGSIAAIAIALEPSVVQLNVSGSQGSGTGSGFILRSDGYILTNNHVASIADGGGSIKVVFNDGSKADATLVGTNPGYDLAVVKVDKSGLPAVTLGSSSALQVGDTAIAIGSPLGLQGTVTSGIISALNRPVTAGGSGDAAYINAIQTDAAINPGNSGGPLVNGSGQVIGINSAIATMGQGGQTGSIGLGFSIPIDTAKRIAEEIIATGTSTTPIMGVELDMNYSGEGAKVTTVSAGGPAASGGVQTGDIVTQFDGQSIADATALIVAIRSLAPGEQVTLTVQRNGQTQDVTVTLGSK